MEVVTYLFIMLVLAVLGALFLGPLFQLVISLVSAVWPLLVLLSVLYMVFKFSDHTKGDNDEL